MKLRTYIGTFFAIVPFFIGLCVYADVEAEIVVATSVPFYASVEKSLSSVQLGTVAVDTGIHGGLSSIFLVKTNGTDDNFDFVITATIDTSAGRVNAYGNDGRILFASVTNPPDSAAVENAKNGSGTTSNVISYPTNVTSTNGLTSEFTVNKPSFGNCYTIYVNGSESGIVTHNVSGTPISDSYSSVLDSQGDYKAVLSFTIVGK